MFPSQWELTFALFRNWRNQIHGFPRSTMGLLIEIESTVKKPTKTRPTLPSIWNPCQESQNWTRFAMRRHMHLHRKKKESLVVLVDISKFFAIKNSRWSFFAVDFVKINNGDWNACNALVCGFFGRLLSCLKKATQNLNPNFIRVTVRHFLRGPA